MSHDVFKILPVRIKVIGMVKITAAIGAKLLLTWNSSTKTNRRADVAKVLKTCVKGKRRNLDHVGLTLYV